MRRAVLFVPDPIELFDKNKNMISLFVVRLTIVLCFVLLDDGHWGVLLPSRLFVALGGGEPGDPDRVDAAVGTQPLPPSAAWRFVSSAYRAGRFVVSLSVTAGVLVACGTMVGVRLDWNDPDVLLTLTPEALNTVLPMVHKPLLVYVFAAVVASGVAHFLWGVRRAGSGSGPPLGVVVWNIALTAMVVAVVVAGFVPFARVDQSTAPDLPTVVHDLYDRSRPFVITSSYGLFRRMTGVGRDAFGTADRLVAV